MYLPLTHKVWKITVQSVLLLLTIQLTLQGFFRQKAVLSNKSPPPQPTIPNDRKVILLMVDALREDFVHFDDNEWTRVGEMS